MTCRICLSDESPETFVSPCRCVGSSSYIHEDCLTTYLSYYPDGVCRVCLTQMESPAGWMLSYLTIGLLGASITYSDVGHWMKFALTATLLGMTVYYSKKRLFHDAIVAFLLVLYLTFATSTHPEAIAIFLLSLYLTSLVFVILVAKRAVLFVFLATPLFVLLFEITVGLDAMATAVYVSLLFLVWYAWIRSTVRNGILTT